MALVHASSLRWPPVLRLLWLWPSTICHEMAHALIGLLTGQRIEGVTVIPRRVKGGWVLGQVSFDGASWQLLPAAMAPLLLIPLAAWAGSEWLTSPAESFFERLLEVYILVVLVEAGFPSAQDYKVGCLPWIGIIAVGLVVYLASPFSGGPR